MISEATEEEYQSNIIPNGLNFWNYLIFIFYEPLNHISMVIKIIPKSMSTIKKLEYHHFLFFGCHYFQKSCLFSQSLL